MEGGAMRRWKMIDSETRRLIMASWCRLKCGEDGWMDWEKSHVMLGILILLACLVCGCEARGDVLCMWHDVHGLVSPATGPLVVEIGTDLAGPGKSLGWIEFSSTREWGPEISVGSWSDAYGTDDGVQTIQIHATAAGTAALAANGAQILDADLLTDFAPLWDNATTFHAGTNYVLFDWSSQIAPTGGGAFGQSYSGRGWISIDSIVTDFAEPGMNDKPSFVVRQIALGTAVYQAGQLLQAVPEPGTWAVLGLVCVVAALWRARG